MNFIIIIAVALVVSLLTFFSGFGVGTLLSPAFMLFFPIQTAIAATAVVHLANNIFKFTLMVKYIDIPTVIRFGVPSFLASVAGALTLFWLTDVTVLFSYSLFGGSFTITPLNLTIGILLVVFALFEMLPRFQHITFAPKYQILGGLLSGFFGGLSGHQGALRSAFLVRSGLSKEHFIGTRTAIAIMVDVGRLIIYGFTINLGLLVVGESLSLVIAGTLAAFIGTFVGAKILHKVTMAVIQYIVGIMLLVLGILIGSGIIGQ